MKIRFRVHGDVDIDLKSAKKLGGQKEMNRIRTNLDIKKWDEISEMVMREILVSKIAENEQVRDILRTCRDSDIILLHHSRSDMKWGGVILMKMGRLKRVVTF